MRQGEKNFNKFGGEVRGKKGFFKKEKAKRGGARERVPILNMRGKQDVSLREGQQKESFDPFRGWTQRRKKERQSLDAKGGGRRRGEGEL